MPETIKKTNKQTNPSGTSLAVQGGKDSMFLLQEARIPYLVRELRSHVMLGMAKIKEEKPSTIRSLKSLQQIIYG